MFWVYPDVLEVTSRTIAQRFSPLTEQDEIVHMEERVDVLENLLNNIYAFRPEFIQN